MSTSPAPALILECEDCDTTHEGHYSYSNKYGQDVYSVEGVCEYHDFLTSEVAVEAPTVRTCLHGCGLPVKNNYKPGHDAKHVANLVQDVILSTDPHAAAVAVATMPTPAMHNKLVRALRKVNIVWNPETLQFDNNR